ncbi:MAG: thioredoxin domain-containing protein [Saprospiraceae bacterium]|nr:thioredoxin domain-containing protein [Saprospiraceae bacterium]
MNKLIDSHSPYLQQHATNPVHWQSWSSSIIEQAQNQHKAILVSIGYSTCHWCHVMAHESFEDHLTAEIMNEHFINVKIDREERPDLDHYFMNAIQAMGISGGWPLNCFLTEDGKPFFGGTYFPPEPKYGRPSWNQILLSVAQAYREKSREILDQADHLVGHLNAINVFPGDINAESNPIDPESLLKQLMSSADQTEGGFGTAPKFPHIQAIQLLMQLYYYKGYEAAPQHVIKSLQSLNAGGIFDQLQGGYCRYSVDGSWNVPHFEKMLYDHAQICEAGFQAYKLSADPFLKEQAERSLVFFENQMRDPLGYFYAAMDADSEGEEGKSYVWQQSELNDVLASEGIAFFELFQLSPLDHVHPHKKVLRLRLDKLNSATFLEEFIKLDKLRIQLLNKRNERSKPSIDKKGIIAWNAMLVGTYAEAYRHTLKEDYKLNAISLLESLLKYGFHSEGHLCRYIFDGKPQAYGFLEDYSFLGKALMEVYQISFEDRYLLLLKNLFAQTLKLFSTPNSVLLKMSSEVHGDFVHEAIEWTESTYPNANVIICQLARYLYQVTGDVIYCDFYTPILKALRPAIAKYPLATASWATILLQEEFGNPLLKANSSIEILEKLNIGYIPGVFLQQDLSLHGKYVLCMQQVCFPPMDKKDSLETKFKDYWTQC